MPKRDRPDGDALDLILSNIMACSAGWLAAGLRGLAVVVFLILALELRSLI